MPLRGEQGLEVLLAFHEVVGHPVLLERHGDPETELGVVRARPLERCAQVRLLGERQVVPLDLS